MLRRYTREQEKTEIASINHVCSKELNVQYYIGCTLKILTLVSMRFDEGMRRAARESCLAICADLER